MEELNIAPIEKIIEERQLSLFGHVHIMNDERLAREIFEVRVPGKNKIGRWDRTSRTNNRAGRYKLERGWNIAPEQRSMEETNWT